MLKFRKGAYANVVATLALLLAMGGTSYATVIITSANIKNGTIQPIDMSPNATVLARSFFHDAGVQISTLDGALDPVVLNKAVPAGSYVITATTDLFNNSVDPVLTRCTLNAGADKDVKHTGLDVNNHAMAGENTTLQVVHKFAHPGYITLRCYSFGDSVSASMTKVTAVKVMKLVNTAS